MISIRQKYFKHNCVKIICIDISYIKYTKDYYYHQVFEILKTI